jgi:hypothetical protein
MFIFYFFAVECIVLAFAGFALGWPEWRICSSFSSLSLSRSLPLELPTQQIRRLHLQLVSLLYASGSCTLVITN